MPREHNAATAKVAYQSLLYAIRSKAKIQITVQKIANSRMYIARSSLMKKSEKLESKWDVNNRNLMLALKKLNAIDPKNQQPKEKCEGSPLTVIGRGDGKSRIVLHPAQGGNAHTIEKALSRYFGAFGKKGPRVVDGSTEEAALSSGLDFDDFVGEDRENALPPGEEENVEHDLAGSAEQELIDSKLRRKIEEGVVADPYKDGPEISDEELARTDGALSEKRRRKEEKRQREAEEAERNRAEKLSPEFRTNVAADVSHIVATQFQVNRLTGEKNRATEAAMVRMITTGLEQSALATSSEAERQRMTRSRMLGLQLVLSFPENLREMQRMANDARGKRGDPWHNLSEANRKWLDKLIGNHEVHDQHDLVDHLFEMARAKAIDLKRRPPGPEGGFWAPYEPHDATPAKLYFFTDKFEGANEHEKLKLLERYIRIVKSWGDHPPRLVDMLSLDSAGTALGWDYQREWPPESPMKRNRFWFLSPQAALTDRVAANAMKFITPAQEEFQTFRTEVKQQKGCIFGRVFRTLKMLRQRTAPTGQPAVLDAAEEKQGARFGDVEYGIEELKPLLSEDDLSEDDVELRPMDRERLGTLVEGLEAKLDDLLKNIDQAESEEDMARRVEEAMRTAIELREQGKTLAADEEVSSEARAPLAKIVAGLDDTLEVLAEIDLRRILTLATRALDAGYRGARAALPTDRKPVPQLGYAMLPFATGEYEMLIEQILVPDIKERAKAIREAKGELAAAIPKLEKALEPLPDDQRKDVLDALRAALVSALERVGNIEQGAAGRQGS